MAEKKQAEPTKKNPWEVKVPVTVPRLPGNKRQPDWNGSVNGRHYTIQRGVSVEVPLPIAEVVERHLKAIEDADDYYNANAN